MLDNRRVYPEIAEGIRCVVRDSGRFAENFLMNDPAASGRGIKADYNLIYTWGDTLFPPKPLFRIFTPPQADGVLKRS
jgi:hypothetical protein